MDGEIIDALVCLFFDSVENDLCAEVFDFFTDDH